MYQQAITQEAFKQNLMLLLFPLFVLEHLLDVKQSRQILLRCIPTLFMILIIEVPSLEKMGASLVY